MTMVMLQHSRVSPRGALPATALAVMAVSVSVSDDPDALQCATRSGHCADRSDSRYTAMAAVP